MSRTVYRSPTALGARGVGFGAAGLGLVTICLSIVVSVGPSGWLRTTLLVVLGLMAAAALLVLVVGALRIWGRGARLVLDNDGFLNATGFRRGARRGLWRDVRKVQVDRSIVSVDLAGGRQSLIHTSTIDVDPRVLARELRTRLNDDRGYRPLTRPADPPS